MKTIATMPSFLIRAVPTVVGLTLSALLFSVALAQTEDDDVKAASVNAIQAAAGSTASAVRTCPSPASGELPLPVDQIADGGVVTLAAGTYYHTGELLIEKPVRIEGAGRDKTRLRFCIGNDESSIQVLSSSVTIKNLAIDVMMRERFPLGGGTGSWGTGITVGEVYYRTTSGVLPTKPTSINTIVIENVEINRKRFNEGASYTGVGIALVGGVSNITVKDVVYKGKHSIALLMHWGGRLGTECTRPTTHLFNRVTEKGYCKFYNTYHPHDVTVNGLDVQGISSSIITLSSTYNIDISNVKGNGQNILMVVPGDEANTFANAVDKPLVGSNIKVKDVDAKITKDGGFTTETMYPIIVYGLGGSKYSDNTVKLPFRDVLVENVKVGPAADSSEFFFNARFALRTIYLGEGSDVTFRNIDFGDMGKKNNDPYAIGAHIFYSSGVTIDSLRSAAWIGAFVANSKNVDIQNSTFDRSHIPASNSDPVLLSRGAVFADLTRGTDPDIVFPGYVGDLLLSNTAITGYEGGIQIRAHKRGGVIKNGSSICDRITIGSDVVMTDVDTKYVGSTKCGYQSRGIAEVMTASVAAAGTFFGMLGDWLYFWK